MRKKIFMPLLIIGTCCLTACDQTPIQSLKSNTHSKKYDGKYWESEHKKNSAIWKEAVEKCSNDPAYATQPNCNLVIAAAFTVPWPGYGKHGGFGVNNFPKVGK